MTDILDRPHAIDWDAIAALGLPEVVTLRRAIHADPELGLDCPRTTRRSRRRSRACRSNTARAASTTGLVAILRGGADNGRTVLLRGDMDALPMHEETGLDVRLRRRRARCTPAATTPTLPCWSARRKGAVRRADQLAGHRRLHVPARGGGLQGRALHDGRRPARPTRAPDAAFALHIMPNAPRGVVPGGPER